MQRGYNISYKLDKLAGFLLLIFSLYYINISLFPHSHVVDGVTIYHSHIYANDHTHSESEVIVIKVLSEYTTEAIPTLSVNFSLFENIYEEFTDHAVEIPHVDRYILPLLRAPPCREVVSENKVV